MQKSFCKALLERKNILSSLVNQNIFYSNANPVLSVSDLRLCKYLSPYLNCNCIYRDKVKEGQLVRRPPTPLFCWAVRTPCHVSNKRQWAFKEMVEWPNFAIEHLGSFKNGKLPSTYFFGQYWSASVKRGGGNRPKYLRPGRFILMDFRLSTWVASFKSQQQDQLATSLLNRSVSVSELVRGEQECHFGVRIWNG